MAKQVNTQLPDDMFARLQGQAVRLGLTVSALVRMAVTEYLDSHERSTQMKDMLVNVTASGMDTVIGPGRPGQEPGQRLNGVTLKITGIPERVTPDEVFKAVNVSAIWWFPDGPFEVPWDLLGFNKDGSQSLIDRERVEKYYENHRKI